MERLRSPLPAKVDAALECGAMQPLEDSSSSSSSPRPLDETSADTGEVIEEEEVLRSARGGVPRLSRDDSAQLPVEEVLTQSAHEQ